MAAWKRGCVHVLGVLSLIVYRTMASCDAGKEPGPSPGSCAKCVPGKFKGVAGTEACASCPINSYSASGRAEDLATATASISAATTSVEGDEISGLALSPTSGSLFMSDRQHSNIKRVEVSESLGSQTGGMVIIAGSRFGSRGSNDGVGTRAKFKRPGDIAIADEGRILFVADTENHLIRKILLTSGGGQAQYTTSSLGQAGLSGYIDGTQDTVPKCRFDTPISLTTHRDGSIFVLEEANSKVRIISSDFTTVSSLQSDIVDLQYARRILFTPTYDSFIIASSAIPSIFGAQHDRLMEVRISDSFRVHILGGDPLNRDGVGNQVRFNQPSAMAWTPEGALLVSQYDGAIRVVDWSTQKVSTLVAPVPGSGLEKCEAVSYKRMHGGLTNTSGLYAGLSTGNDNDEVQLIRWELNTGATACSSCPAGTITAGAAAKSIQDCTLSITTSTSVASTTSTPLTTTTPPPQEADTTLTPEVIAQVQTTVATVVAGAVATSVATTVVMSASGASSGASSGSGSMSAVTQVQMLSQVGRMGGSRSSSALSTASCGFGWSNYNPSSLGTDGFLGRNAPEYCANFTQAAGQSCNKAKPKLNVARRVEVPPECKEQCGWDTVAPSLEQLIMCAICLVLVSVARMVISAILIHCVGQEPSPSMQFPMWEGPVFLTQFMAISESLIRLVGVECPFIQAGAGMLLAAGPVAFMSYTAYRLFANKRHGELEYEPADWPSWTACKEAMAEAKWYGKLYALYDYVSALKVRGGWSDGNTAGRHWGFLVGDFTKFAYLFCVWLMIKKILLLTTMEHLDGEVNAGSALALQGLDTVMLLVLLPFNDMQDRGLIREEKQVTFVEVLAGITNALAYFSIALPILGWSWPALELPEAFKLLLASCGAAFAGISSFCGSIIQLVKGCLMLSGHLKIPGNGALDLMAAAGAGGLVAGFLADEALAQAQEKLKTGNPGDEEEDQDLEKDSESSMMLELDTDYDSISDKQAFGEEVCQDVARAAGLDAEAGDVRIVEILKAPGSKTGVLVHLAISSGQMRDQAARQAVANAPAEANASMLLDLEFSDIEGKEEEFKKEMVDEIASALDADKNKIHVLSLAPGSIWVHLQLEEGACPIRSSSPEMRQELRCQARDPESKLRACKHAKHIKLLTCPEDMMAQDEVSSKPSEVIKKLREQLDDENSLLRTGRHTSKALSLQPILSTGHGNEMAKQHSIDRHGPHEKHHDVDAHIVHVDAHLVHWSKTFLDARAVAHARAEGINSREEPADEEDQSNSAGRSISVTARDVFQNIPFDPDAADAAVTAVVSSPVTMRSENLLLANSRMARLLARSPIPEPVPAARRPYSPDFPVTLATPTQPEEIDQFEQDLLLYSLRPRGAAGLQQSEVTLENLNYTARTPELPQRPPKILNEKGQVTFYV